MKSGDERSPATQFITFAPNFPSFYIPEFVFLQTQNTLYKTSAKNGCKSGTTDHSVSDLVGATQPTQYSLLGRCDFLNVMIA